MVMVTHLVRARKAWVTRMERAERERRMVERRVKTGWWGSASPW